VEIDSEYVGSADTLVPFRYTAPEALTINKHWSPACDVFSFGIFLWELFSFGKIPFEDFSVDGHTARLKEISKYLQKPINCSPKIYNLMEQCWHFDHDNRTNFIKITTELQNISNLSSRAVISEHKKDTEKASNTSNNFSINLNNIQNINDKNFDG